MEKIEIVTACYNESPERIHYTFESIVSQDYPALELAIVDGGSKASTLKALAEYQPRIKTFISEADNGLYDAMNKGVRNSTGDWIIFMNIGDRFHDACTLSKVMDSGNLQDIQLIYGDIMESGKRYISPPRRLSSNYLFNQTICHQSMLTRKSVFERLGLFDISYRIIADREWILRFYRSGLSYKHLPIIICDWASGSVCSNYKKMDQEIIRYQFKDFSFYERVFYSISWFITRTYRRIKSFDLSVPVRLKDKYRY